MSGAVRIALATPPYPASPGESVRIAEALVVRAAEDGAVVVWFPECGIPRRCASQLGAARRSSSTRTSSWAGRAPYGREGLLVADLDLSLATGLLAKRYRPV